MNRLQQSMRPVSGLKPYWPIKRPLVAEKSFFKRDCLRLQKKPGCLVLKRKWMTLLKQFKGHPPSTDHHQGPRPDIRQAHKATIGLDKDPPTIIGEVPLVVTDNMTGAQHPGKMVVIHIMVVIHLITTKEALQEKEDINLHNILPILDIHHHNILMPVGILQQGYSQSPQRHPLGYQGQAYGYQNQPPPWPYRDKDQFPNQNRSPQRNREAPAFSWGQSSNLPNPDFSRSQQNRATCAYSGSTNPFQQQS